MNDSSSCSFFTISGSPSSFHKLLNRLKACPLPMSFGPIFSRSFCSQTVFPFPLQCSISTSITGFPVSQSIRSRIKDLSAGKFSQGSRLTELSSISFMISSRHANFLFSDRLFCFFDRIGSSPQSSVFHSSQNPVAADTGFNVCVDPKALGRNNQTVSSTAGS
jgi:hypothetical protein